MPAKFDACRKAGGKIRTKSMSGGRYMHVCVEPGGKKGPRGGRTVAGEVKRKKGKK